MTGPAAAEPASENAARAQHEPSEREVQPRSGRLPSGVNHVLRSAGQPLEPTVRAFMEERFGHDFANVRVHTGPQAEASATEIGAKAYTVGSDVVFGAGTYLPDTTDGRRAIAHELAHVVQQGRGGGSAPAFDAGHALERDAHSAAHAGGPVAVKGASAVGLARNEMPLSEEIRQSRPDKPKGEIFDLLRRRRPTRGDVEPTRSALRARFADGTDDRWLAEALLDHGAEPLWPDALLTERSARSTRGKWPTEAGNIRAELPYPPEAVAGKTPPVVAYFFPGSTNERALVVGGIHGSEPQGARVVEGLRNDLAASSAAGKPPRFTTILVPILNAQTHDVAGIEQDVASGTATAKRSRRYLPRRDNERNPDRAARSRESSDIEPNRTFPGLHRRSVAEPGGGSREEILPETYADIRARAAGGGPELKYTGPLVGKKAGSRAQSSAVMPPETRALVQLVERFRPSRIAAAHAHDTEAKPRPGNDPGIFVDPAIRRDAHGSLRTDPDRFDPSGDVLANQMLKAGRDWWTQPGRSVPKGAADPFRGNFGPTPTRYENSVATNEGYSLGDWGSAMGINVITIEVPQYATPAQLPQIEAMHRDVLLHTFLGVP